MYTIFILCLVACAAVTLVALVGGTGNRVRSLDEMYARRAAMAPAQKSAWDRPTMSSGAGTSGARTGAAPTESTAPAATAPTGTSHRVPEAA